MRSASVPSCRNWYFFNTASYAILILASADAGNRETQFILRVCPLGGGGGADVWGLIPLWGTAPRPPLSYWMPRLRHVHHRALSDYHRSCPRGLLPVIVVASGRYRGRELRGRQPQIQSVPVLRNLRRWAHRCQHRNPVPLGSLAVPLVVSNASGLLLPSPCLTLVAIGHGFLACKSSATNFVCPLLCCTVRNASPSSSLGATLLVEGVVLVDCHEKAKAV